MGFTESVAINSTSGLFYVADTNYQTMAVISEKANQPQAVWNVGNSPEALLPDPSNNTLYVADYFDFTVSALDADTSISEAIISTGYGPTGLALDPTTHTL